LIEKKRERISKKYITRIIKNKQDKKDKNN